MSELEQYRTWLHEAHGHRICVALQFLGQQEMKKAYAAERQAQAFASALTTFNAIDDGTYSTEETYYTAVSKARLTAEINAEESDSELKGVGVQ